MTVGEIESAGYLLELLYSFVSIGESLADAVSMGRLIENLSCIYIVYMLSY